MRQTGLAHRGAALLAIALVAAACSSSTPSTTNKGTLASTFVFGAPPDCATNKFCAIGLKSTYGIVFKEVKSLDFGGPATRAALTSGAVQVGELFSTSIYDPTFVALKDDKHLEAADYLAPVVRTAVATPNVVSLLDGVSAKLTTENIVPLNKAFDVDHKDAKSIAKTFLQDNGLLASKTATGSGKKISVGVSGAYEESEIVAEMYAQVLENAGYKVTRKLSLAARAASDTALFSGAIDVKPEYLASEARHIDPNADVSGDPVHTAAVLKPLLAAKGITLLNYSNLLDTNVFVVTQTTATRYSLVNVSDLAKQAT
jgi:glycine betaine/choline ABC-type transport system substrate-binding protein